MAAREDAGAGPAGLVVIGLFPDPDAAARSIQELRDAGFTKEEIGAIMPRRGPGGEPLAVRDGEDLELETEATRAGAATGGIIGGLLGLLGSLLIPGLGPVTLGGVLASTLLGAGAGVLTGGLIGLLVGLGASRAEAEYFDRGVRAGSTLVTVQPDATRVAEARSILQRVGGDLGPSARPTGGVTSGEETEPWRGNERRYRQHASFSGPERRKAHV